MIFDRNENFPVFFGGFNRNRRVIRTEFDCITEKIIQNLLDLFHVGLCQQLPAGQNQLQKNITAGAGTLKGSCGCFDYTVDIKRLNVQHTFLNIEFVESQKPAGKLFQTLCFI